MQDLNGAAKPALDDAELNHLVNLYEQYLERTGREISIDREWKLKRIVTDSELSKRIEGADSLAQEADMHLHESEEHFNLELPSAINLINVAQSQLLARTNQIYDQSAVKEPLNVNIDWGDKRGNLLVYFDICQAEAFPRYTVPIISQVSTIQSASVVPTSSNTGNNSTAGQTGTPGQTLSVAQVVAPRMVVAVHDFYKATVAAAFGLSFVRDRSIESRLITSGQAIDGSSCSTSTPCSQQFVDVGSYVASLVVGVNYYLSKKGHDTYPGAVNRFNQKLGVYGGLSATRLNSYFLGLGYEPVEALQLMGGVNFASQNAISSQFNPSSVYAGTPSFSGASSWGTDGFVGIGFNLSIFRKIFGSVTQLGTKVTGTGS